MLAIAYTPVVAIETSARMLREPLRKTWLFADLEPAQLERIAQLAHVRAFVIRDAIVTKGEPGDGLYVLLSGCVSVTSVAVSGETTAFRLLGPGEVFGEIALLDGCPRSATVTAMGPCKTAFIPQAAFQGLLLEYPVIALELLSLLSRRIRALSERVEDRAFFPIKTRLAKTIVGLADKHGAPLVGGGVRIPLPLSQRELGRLVDATRESVNKQLRSWTTDGVLRHHRSKLDVFDLDMLRSQCN